MAMFNYYTMLKYKNSFYTLFIISLLYVFPLILANFYFIDDTNRINDFYGWKHLGRPFADLLFHIISVGSFIDLFPLTLIFTCIFISFSSLLLINRLSLNYNKFYSFFIVLPILCSPLYLENLSYRNDNIFMSFASLCSIISASIKYKKKYSFFYKTLFLFIALGSYQISLNIFVSLAFLFFIHDNLKSTSSLIALKNLTQSLLIGLITYIIYYILIIKILLGNSPDQYLKDMEQTIPLNKNGIALFFNNIEITILYFFYNFKKSHLVLTGILFIISYVIILFKKEFSSKNENKIYIVLEKIIFIISPFIVCLCIPGLLLIKNNFNFQPRMLMSASIFIIFIFYSLNYVLLKYWKYLLVIPYIYFFSLIYSYGSSLSIMKSYNEYLFTQISHDLYSLKIKNNDNIYILGSPPQPNQVTHFINKNKFTDFFFQANSINGNVDGGAGFVTHGLFRFHNLHINMPLLTNKNYVIEVKNNPTIDQGIYKIYKNDNEYVIWFP